MWLEESLGAIGVRIDDGGRGALPLTVEGTGQLPGGRCDLDSSTSSQFLSAVLIAATRANADVVVDQVGATVPSMPHIAMTVAMLRERGIDVDDSTPNVWCVTPGTIPGGVVDVGNVMPSSVDL